MDPVLTQSIHITLPTWKTYPRLPSIQGYKDLSTKIPILERFLGTLPTTEGQLESDTYFARPIEFQGSGKCIIELSNKEKVHSYCKVVHMLDPVRTLQGYYIHPEKGARRIEEKVKNPHNQAYVDFLANYLLGQLALKGISPHFCRFYGGFQGVADIYRYNITDSFSSYRKYRSFWERKRQGLFSLYTDSGDSILNTPMSSLHSRSFSYSTTDSYESDKSHISILGPVVSESVDELESIDDISALPEQESDESDSEDESEYSDEETLVFSEYKKYPTVLIFQEMMDGVFDDLLNDPEETLPEREERWVAWTFQIIAALCVAQGVLGLTHNDLHTNNVLFKNTKVKYLYYKSRDGTTWKVPTFGRILRIIDFGRSVYHVKDTWFCSDDFEKGGDAEGQYSFDEFKKIGQETICPNPSFDLCRYSVSIIEALFPIQPVNKEDGLLLSSEDGWEVRETVSPLWNLLWSWLIDDEGMNVLRNKDNVERFPNFDLYEHIAAYVHTAKPQDQLHKPIFAGYITKESSDKVYPLYC
jgi:hypothetical protein